MNAPDVSSLAKPSFALREAHAHVHMCGRATRMVDLGACADAAEFCSMLAGAIGARDADASVPLLAQGARPEGYAVPGWPSLAMLDDATGTTPVCCWCFDYHALMVNAAGLLMVGLDATSRDPEGGALGRDNAGALTGVLYEQAALDAWERFTSGTTDPAELLAGVDVLAGFGAIDDLKSPPDLGDGLRAIVDARLARGEEPPTFRMYALLEHLDALMSSRERWSCEHVQLAGGKIFVDGTLNSRTAWMLSAYADGNPAYPEGMSLLDTDEIARAIERCVSMGIGLAAHAIGDGAVRAVLDAAERVGAPRHSVRIEHAELIHEDDVDRFARLGVIASVQPCHLLPDIEALRRALPSRLDRVLPIRDLLASGLEPGVDLLFGSDAPIVRPDPEDSVLAAVYRRRTGMDERDAIALEQAIDEETSWACFRAPA